MTMIEVTQAGRNAAADAVKAYRDQKNGDWQGRIRRGECDDGTMVQAFAAHGQRMAQAAAKLALERAATKARTLYLFPKPTSRAAQYHEKIVQGAISDEISKLDPIAIAREAVSE